LGVGAVDLKRSGPGRHINKAQEILESLAHDPLAITSPLAEFPDDALITWFHVQMGGKISGMLFFFSQKCARFDRFMRSKCTRAIVWHIKGTVRKKKNSSSGHRDDQTSRLPVPALRALAPRKCGPWQPWTFNETREHCCIGSTQQTAQQAKQY